MLSSPATAILFTVLLWWASTAALLYLNHLPRHTYPRSAGVLVALAIMAFGSLGSVSEQHEVRFAYLGFIQGLLLWAALESTYLMGMLTGPHATPCPRDASRRERFRLAIGTSLYHELAVIAVGMSTWMICYGATNRVAWWTFMTLWFMRWSTKLNIFLGVRNINLEWFPEHLRYLDSYVTHRPMNLLFPFSVGIAGSVGLHVISRIAETESPFMSTSLSLVLTILLLGLLEHIFLVLPIKDSVLWDWAQRRATTRQASKS